MEGSVALEDFPLVDTTSLADYEKADAALGHAELPLHVEPQRLFAWLDRVAHGQCLTHCATLQRQMAPATSNGGLWELEFADYGFGCLASGDEVICFEDILHKTVWLITH